MITSDEEKQALLKIKDVSKSYGNVYALKGISMSVMRGEWVSIMGPSGSGKTTLLNIIGGMDQPSQGQVILDGVEQQRVCIARALINYPKLILADEPTGNLDEANEKIVVDLLRGLHRDGHTIIIVTHDTEIGKLGDYQVYLEHGSVHSIESGAIRQA